MQWTDMPSKGGKGKGSKIDQKSKKKTLPQQPQSLQAMYEGAIDNSNFFECLQKNSQKWMKVRVIGAKLISHEYPFTETSYEYYIHYENENRRWDEWITIDKLKPTDERIPDEPKRQQQKVKANDFNEYDEHEGFNQEALNLHLEHTKFKTIKQVKIGKYLMDTWYYSAFPLNYQNVDILYFCDFCLSFYKHESELLRHKKICLLHTPPGNEIYRDDSQETSISMFEVDGRKSTVYVENLSYFSKLFLDHKNLYWNMETFLFYVLCENDSEGSHVVGYFSKEKESKDNYNLSCILVFPIHQRKGYGKFLITFSFELSAIEDKIGTPERPLSDLGRKSYLAWWSQRIIQYLESKPDTYVLTVEDITKNTYIKDKDVLWTLEQKGIVKYSGATSMICTDPSFLKKIYKDAGSPGVPVFRQNIHWVPFRASLSKDCVSKQPEYDPMTGSNYTHVFLKNIVGLAQTSQLGGQKHKKTPSKKNTQKQLTSTLQATPTSHNQNSNSLPINSHTNNNNNISNNGTNSNNNTMTIPSGNNMNNHMMGNHNTNYVYGNNINNDMNPMNPQEHQFEGHLYPVQVQSSLQ